MSASFWLSLGVCLGSLPIAISEGKEAFEEAKAATGLRRLWSWTKFVLLIGIPIASLLGTILSGAESSQADQRASRYEAALMESSNKLAAAAQRANEAQGAASNALAQAKRAEESTKPRRLTESAKSDLGRMLSSLPKSGISLACQIGDAEANDLMTDLSESFMRAGFALPNMALLPGTLTPGIVIETPHTNVPPQIMRVATAFAAVGLKGTLGVVPNASETNVMVYIGSKPRD